MIYYTMTYYDIIRTLFIHPESEAVEKLAAAAAGRVAAAQACAEEHQGAVAGDRGGDGSLRGVLRGVERGAMVRRRGMVRGSTKEVERSRRASNGIEGN